MAAILEAVYSTFSGIVTSYYNLVVRVKWAFEYCVSDCRPIWPLEKFAEELTENARITWHTDILLILLLAVVWTTLRFAANNLAQKLVRRCGISKKYTDKFGESSWRCLAYITLLSYSCYTVFGVEENRHIFFQPDTLWDDYKPGMEIPAVIYYLYITQLAFYVHSLYATLFLDIWRNDHIIMITHHLITIALIGFSFAMRCHKIGLLVVLLHDPSDVLLDAAKCCVYFGCQAAADVIFTLFTISWFVFRIYWFPLKALHSAGYGTMKFFERTGQGIPLLLFFNALLWMLMILHIWWSGIILNAVFRVLGGKEDLTEVDDTIEDQRKSKLNKDGNRASSGKATKKKGD